MRTFDGNDHIIWIFQMNKFFDLHQASTLQNVAIASLYLDPNQFVWYQWIYDWKKDFTIFWSIFTNKFIAHYEDIKRHYSFI